MINGSDPHGEGPPLPIFVILEMVLSHISCLLSNFQKPTCSSLYLTSFFYFLDASTHLYMRVCQSVRWSVYLSIGPLRVFFTSEIDKSDKSNKPTNLTNLTESDKSDKSDKSLCNSILVPYFRRIFVQANLFNSFYGKVNYINRPVFYIISLSLLLILSLFNRPAAIN